MKIDIKKYFYNINHEILFEMIKKDIKDRDALRIIKIILDSTDESYVNEENLYDSFMNICYILATIDYNDTTIKYRLNDEKYKAFTNYVLNNSNDENVLKYLKQLENITTSNISPSRLFDDSGNLKSDWQNTYNNLRNDHNLK